MEHKYCTDRENSEAKISSLETWIDELQAAVSAADRLVTVLGNGTLLTVDEMDADHYAEAMSAYRTARATTSYTQPSDPEPDSWDGSP